MSTLALALGILTLAKPIATPLPAYPPNATAGAVVVAALDVSSGRVERVSIVGGREPFAASARVALSGWRFPASIRRLRIGVVVAFRSPYLAFPGGTGELTVPASARPSDMPFPTRIVEPPYPPNAAGDGAAVVRLAIDATGSVVEATAIRNSGSLTGSCVDAARRWTFAPALDAARRPTASETFVVCVFRSPVIPSNSR